MNCVAMLTLMLGLHMGGMGQIRMEDIDGGDLVRNLVTKDSFVKEGDGPEISLNYSGFKGLVDSLVLNSPRAYSIVLIKELRELELLTKETLFSPNKSVLSRVKVEDLDAFFKMEYGADSSGFDSLGKSKQKKIKELVLLTGMGAFQPFKPGDIGNSSLYPPVMVTSNPKYDWFGGRWVANRIFLNRKKNKVLRTREKPRFVIGSNLDDEKFIPGKVFSGLLFSVPKVKRNGSERKKRKSVYFLGPGHSFPKGSALRQSTFLCPYGRKKKNKKSEEKYFSLRVRRKYWSEFACHGRADFSLIKVKRVGKLYRKHSCIPKLPESCGIPPKDSELIQISFPRGVKAQQNEVKHVPLSLWKSITPVYFTSKIRTTEGCSGATIYQKSNGSHKWVGITASAGIVGDDVVYDSKARKYYWKGHSRGQIPSQILPLSEIRKTILEPRFNVKREIRTAFKKMEVTDVQIPKTIQQRISLTDRSLVIWKDRLVYGSEETEMQNNVPITFYGNGEGVSNPSDCSNRALECYGDESVLDIVERYWPYDWLDEEKKLGLEMFRTADMIYNTPFTNNINVTVLGGIGLADFVDELPGSDTRIQQFFAFEGNYIELMRDDTKQAIRIRYFSGIVDNYRRTFLVDEKLNYKLPTKFDAAPRPAY